MLYGASRDCIEFPLKAARGKGMRRCRGTILTDVTVSRAGRTVGVQGFVGRDGWPAAQRATCRHGEARALTSSEARSKLHEKVRFLLIITHHTTRERVDWTCSCKEATSNKSDLRAHKCKSL